MRLLIFFSLALLLLGCEQSPQAQPEQVTSTPPPTATEQQDKVPASTVAAEGLFNQPTIPQRLELPSEALPHWRAVAKEKPALVLFSFDPFLNPIDSRLQEQARQLTLSGTVQEMRQHGGFNTAEPVILPTQTVTAALSADFFSKIYWVFPSKVLPEQLNLSTFKEQMLEQQILTEEEAAQINFNGGIYSGQVRGVPFEAIHYQRLAEISGPLVLHIDMSFFRGLYDNEIKSPIYTMLRGTIDQLHQLGWSPLATTLSYSTLEGAVALDVRFVITNFAELMEEPQRLAADMPQEWQLRSEALYAADMYSESKKQELALQSALVAPESAAAHYDHFQALFMGKQLDDALQALKRAVEIDPGYGAAYLQLAQMAANEGQLSTAMELLTEAEKLFPESPFIPLQKAHLLVYLEQHAEAEKIIAGLPQSWSPVHHDNIPDVISELRQSIEAASSSSEQKE